MSAERGAARRALRLTKLEHKLFRSNILSIAFGFRFRLSIVVPVNMPLPTKIVTQVLQPIDIAAAFGDDPGVAEIDAHVRSSHAERHRPAGPQAWLPIFG